MGNTTSILFNGKIYNLSTETDVQTQINQLSDNLNNKANIGDSYTKEESDERHNKLTKDINYDINVIDKYFATKNYVDDKIENIDIGDIDIGELIARPVGIPVYTEDKLDEDRSKGIEIDDKDVIMIDTYESASHQSQNSSETYQYTGNETYLDILFSTLRALQSEVTRLKNSFNYGIESYNGKNTTTSTVISEYEEEDEPLWAVDEDSLAEIPDEQFVLKMNNEHIFTPRDAVEDHDGFLKILEDATFQIDPEVLNNIIYTDNKVFLYLTSNSLDIDFKFTNLNNLDNTITVNLSNICNPSENSKFNIFVVINKEVAEGEGDDITWSGKNYIYFSVNDYITDNVSKQGYYKNGQLWTGHQYLPERYMFDDIKFNAPLTLYKFNMYSRKDNFFGTDAIDIEETPLEKEYKYKAAHITVRVIDTYAEAEEIKSQLLEGEPLYIKDRKGLYIIIDGTIKTIGSASDKDSEKDQDTGMTEQEIIALLQKNGIINITEDGDQNISLNNIADITFINQNSGKRFKFEVNDEGELHPTELTEDDFETRIQRANLQMDISEDNISNIRGFIGSLGNKENQARSGTFNYQGDLVLYSDRLKIGAVYAPNEDQEVFGCSHAYIELENTSDKDINLDNFYIHYARDNEDNELIMDSLKLEGHIPAGGTYLIRGKQYSNYDQANTYIKVKTYDIEWYSGSSLIDLTWHKGKRHTYLLSYGIPENFSPATKMTKPITIGEVSFRGYHPRYVDSISINKPISVKATDGSDAGTWYWIDQNSWVYFVPPTKNGKYLDVIFRNTFMLDPAKQAYQGLAATITKKLKTDKVFDSSRARNNTATDYQYLSLENDVISFPKSEETYDVAKFTPKASFEHKNVCTDKTQLDLEKPNAVTVAFGINMNTTRCFNWVSGGYFDEYIWLRRKGETIWEYKFESYHDSERDQDELGEIVQDSEFPRRKKFGRYLNKMTGKYDAVETIVYDRITNVFPGSKTAYTSHKCVIDLVSEPVDNPQTWEYIVGRANPNGGPNKAHISDIYEFTLYPASYTPRIFQTTDQQGFHWVEYQHWAAAANEINNTINATMASLPDSSGIVPVLLNTGDMTQNGSRANEWLDYYNAGLPLFKHLEQMNVVGNNDLCSSTDVTELGTGDDGNGKTNAYYFHVFYCYEIDTDIMPIISNERASKYIPSFYYFGNGEYTFVMINSEINVGNCTNWFKQIKDGHTVNIYTGWEISNSGETISVYDDSFKTVYTMIYEIFENKIPNISKCIVACHEMPFTVVTNDNLSYDNTKHLEAVNRSLSKSNTGSLVGSHTNIMSNLDYKSNYWFSRLLEHFNVGLVIGGHKHTYACTHPLRELYAYEVDGVTKYSNIDGPMTMTNTLQNDTVNFNLYYKDGNVSVENTEGSLLIHSSKFPIAEINATYNIKAGINNDSQENPTVWYPYFGVESIGHRGVVYCMCQATGYKLKSNKELPSTNQKFAYIVPETNIAESKPSNKQLYSMFTEITMDNNQFDVYLYRILNITVGSDTSAAKEFTQITYSTKPCSYEYLAALKDGEKSIIFGKWNKTKAPLVSIDY